MSRLSAWNTLNDAVSFLESETRHPWSLSQLIEAGCMPRVWLEPGPGAPPQLFAGRTEGFAAPMLFAGDTQRLAFDNAKGVLTMTLNPDGLVFRFNPGLPVAADELRFARLDLERTAGSATGSATPESPEQRPGEGKRDWQLRLLRAKARALGIDLQQRAEGDITRLRDALDSEHPGAFTNWDDIWKAAKSRGIARPIRSR